MKQRVLGVAAVLSVAAVWACSSSSGGNGAGNDAGTGGDVGTGSSSGSASSSSGSSSGGVSEGGSEGGSGSSSGGSSGSSSGGSSGSSSGGMGGPTWTLIDLVDDPGGDSGTPQQYKGAATVAGIWFSSTSNGDVALLPSSAATAGAVEHLSGAKTVDSIALSGTGTGTGGQNDDYDAFWMVGGTLYASSRSFGDQAHPSSDNGKTFQTVASSSNATPNAQWIWMSKDSATNFHLVDDIGNVWTSTTGPVATTSWTRTWNPEASPPVPSPVPAADCQFTWHQDYFAQDAQQAFFVSSDGKTMIYNAGANDVTGVCRSTDGGQNFVPVAFPNPPNPGANAETPYVILFTSDKNGIAAYANDLSPANSAYVYTTSDGGATWTLATFPSMPSQFAITNGFAAPDGQHIWLGGFTNDSPPKLVLWKSSDGGKTWKDVGAALTTANAGAMYKLHSGFALDANNIWVGGDNGGLAYSPTGGE